MWYIKTDYGFGDWHINPEPKTEEEIRWFLFDKFKDKFFLTESFERIVSWVTDFDGITSIVGHYEENKNWKDS